MKNRRPYAIFPTVAFAVFCLAATARPESRTLTVSFETCIAAIQRTITLYGIGDADVIYIVRSDSIQLTKLCTDEASSILISCSRPDRKMVIEISSDREGCPVE